MDSAILLRSCVIDTKYQLKQFYYPTRQGNAKYILSYCYLFIYFNYGFSDLSYLYDTILFTVKNDFMRA